MSASAVKVVVGYDGSLAAGAAIRACARLLPVAHATIGHLWTPPFASEQLRRQLWTGTRHVDAFVETIQQEGRREAERIAGMGVALAHAAGWTAEPLVVRCFGGEGFELTQLARTVDAELLLVGSRGLGGTKALLGSVSDLAVHYATQPILVAPYPLLAADDDALPAGPVLVAWDGSAGASGALDVAARLWPDRHVLLATVDQDVDPPPLPDDGPRTSALRLTSSREGSSRAVAEALARAAREHGAAVVVLGSRRRSAVREIVLGSVAMSTLHRAHRLVLVVPPPDGADAAPTHRR